MFVTHRNRGKLTRRSALAGLSACVAAPALAQSNRNERVITLVHGFTTGGNVDIVGRIIAERLGARIGQQIVIDPRPGAGGTTAAAWVARTPPDGSTLAILPGGHAVSAAIYNHLPYRPIDDFSWIGMMTDFPFIFATYPDHPAKSVSDLIRAARAQEGQLLCATPGNGTGQHLSLALFAAMAGIKVQHVPYRGSPPAITDLVAKRLDTLMDTPTALLEWVKDGRLRALATTGASRFFALPDVPTIAEAGVSGYAVTSWLGLAGPAGLPADMIARLNTELVAVLAEPATIEKLRNLGSETMPTTPDGFKSRVLADIEKWTQVVAQAGIARI
jgi:tripartite-type tricarboxylate transporter receptor subunit TctC